MKQCRNCGQVYEDEGRGCPVCWSDSPNNFFIQTDYAEFNPTTYIEAPQQRGSLVGAFFQGFFGMLMLIFLWK